MEKLSSSEVCPLCKGANVVHPVGEDGKVIYDKTISCICVRDGLVEGQKQAAIERCEFPPMVEDMTFSNFEEYTAVRTALSLANAMADNPGKLAWLTLMGENGVGKTHLAVAVCKAWVTAGIPARYAYVPLLLDELREGFKETGDDSYYARFQYFCTVPLLLLDDIGAESSTAWVQEKLETLINYRLMYKLSLLLTTNKPIEKLSDKISSRLLRLKEANIVNIDAEDYMLSKLKKQEVSG